MHRSTRFIVALVVAADIVALIVAGTAYRLGPGEATAHAVGTKVAIIVGPAGEFTGRYRALADEAARSARRRYADVVTVYSPNATWPAVREALDGASIVVYLGHGNGWPSPHRDYLFPETQNGLGLNPVAGQDDVAHQYFGEAYLARAVRLAPDAVVLLHHLCYASGNPEPGGPEPSPAVATQRVDNFAAGWLTAGAGAVVAEGHLGPDYYVSAILDGRDTIESIWRASPRFHDHVTAFDSTRSPGLVGLLDPDAPGRGYFRSLVGRTGLTAAAVLAGGPSVGNGPAASEAPTLANRGITFGTPALDGPPIASSHRRLSLPFTAPAGVDTSDVAMVGIRWDPIDVAGAASDGSAPAASTAAESSEPDTLLPDPGASVASDPPADTNTDGDVGATPLNEAGDGMIRAEVLGAVVAAVPSARDAAGASVDVVLPAKTGTYRLVTLVHDTSGIAFDAATQAQIPALIVRVAGELWATIEPPAAAVGRPGRTVTVPVTVTNSGLTGWEGTPAPETIDPTSDVWLPRLVAHWVSLDGSPIPPNATVGGWYVAPGERVRLDLPLVMPATVGRYLLVLDVVLPTGRSLAADGVPPGLIRVTVNDAPAPAIGAPGPTSPGAGGP